MMRANVFGSEAQGDFLREIVLVNTYRAAGDQPGAAVEIERYGFSFHAGCPHGEVELELASAKRELRSSHVGYAHVSEAFRIADADGKHRHHGRAASFQAFSVA